MYLVITFLFQCIPSIFDCTCLKVYLRNYKTLEISKKKLKFLLFSSLTPDNMSTIRHRTFHDV